MTEIISKIIRSRRTTVSLEINPDASVVVRAPYYATKQSIEQFVSQQRDWITKARKEFLQRPRYSKKQFIAGEVFQFLGCDYNLNFGHLQKQALILRENFYLATWAQENAEHHFTEWYKQQAREYIPQRVHHYAQLHMLEFNKIKINSAKKRYGSCSEEGNINFAWRLMMTPLDVIDYIVVHELAHLVHQDHSRAFWRKVASMLPDYKKQVSWLDYHGHLLDF